ncbi:hypothetical protein JAAARDRAFT_141856 [Jaapia argillacea MUCL 33604]|uniref:GST N-terminal domain-containing protein n=1 Tax=Jaapia argillacea MUCL 33604 TaxID=933084 RepID=A0A067P9K9_9AGAM|nr:hypothetical protein JAAARDRAFT_141856 [Jaapia argillacea MUCL 33604]
MSLPITLFDIPAAKVKGGAWSPNTWKTRYALGFKGLPFKTVWLEYPDIEAALKQVGAKPTTNKPDGTPLYTLPVIHDPNTKQVICDSFAIAEYLDATYPNGPLLFPKGTKALQASFESALTSTALSPLFPLLLPASGYVLNPSSAVYFRQTRESWYGKKLEEFCPDAEKAAQWKKVEEGFSAVTSWVKLNGGGAFVIADTCQQQTTTRDVTGSSAG